MMTVELSTIHTGIMAAAESFGFCFGVDVDTGVGREASRLSSRSKGFDSESSCKSWIFSPSELLVNDMAVSALEDRGMLEFLGRKTDKGFDGYMISTYTG